MNATEESARVELVSPTGERVSVVVEIADDWNEQEIGLMHREKLPAGTGMLFVFQSEFPQAFWMKNTLIPLDILFFDHGKRFVSSATMVPCEDDPCAQYPSADAAQYALEVNAGFLKENTVGPGWVLVLDSEKTLSTND